MRRTLVGTAFLCGLCVAGHGAEDEGSLFHATVRVTDSSANYRMSANPSRQAAFDAGGQLHAAWWTGALETTTTTPSEVLYASWNAATGWSSLEMIDDSFDAEGNRIGGRNPSLTIGGDGSVWVAWQDHRHCRPGSPYNWIDNIEIYADRKPPGGSFSPVDLRLTTSVASHFGDNGYAPRIVAGADGDVRVVWYDFHFNANVSDLFVKTAPAGVFDLSESMSDMRISRYEDRPIGPPFGPAALSHPEIAMGPGGDWSVIWTEGFGLPGPLLFSALPAEGFLGSGQVVATQTDGYNNPASMRHAPDGGLWVGWTDRQTSVARVALRRRGAQTGTFESTWFLTDGTRRSEGLSFSIDDDGLIHAAWVEVESFQQNRIRYALLNPADRSIVHQQLLTEETGAWVKPCVVVTNSGVPHVLYGEYYGDGPADTGDIWHAEGIAPPSGASDVFFLF